MTDIPVGSPLPGTLGSGRRDVLTVAQLLSRMSSGATPGYTPVARQRGAQIVSVGSLLRREGRAPHAQDRPLRPRAARQTEHAGHSGAWPARPAGRRRATAVAGALVAAGSVLGAALYNGAASHSSDAQAAADGLFPGLGLPAGAPATRLPADYLPATVALAGPLPAPTVLSPGATDWMRFAFGPTAPGAPPAGALVAGAAPSVGGAVPAARDAAAAAPTAARPVTALPTAPPAAVPGPSAGQAPSGGLLPAVPFLSGGGDRTPAPNVLAPVFGGGSGGSQDPGTSGGTGPVQRVTEPLRPAGETVGGVLRPVASAAAPVGDTVGTVVTPVGEAARPLTRALAPVTRPVADAVEPVTTPVLEGVAPVTEPVLEATEPLTGPVLTSLDPVTGLLDTSAATDDDGAADAESGGSASGKHARTPSTDPSTTVSGLTDRLGGTVGSLTGGATEQEQGTSAPKAKDLVGSTLGGLTGG